LFYRLLVRKFPFLYAVNQIGITHLVGKTTGAVGVFFWIVYTSMVALVALDRFACLVLRKTSWMEARCARMYIFLAYLYASGWWLALMLPWVSFEPLENSSWDYVGQHGRLMRNSQMVNDSTVIVCIVLCYTCIAVRLTLNVSQILSKCLFKYWYSRLTIIF